VSISPAESLDELAADLLVWLQHKAHIIGFGDGFTQWRQIIDGAWLWHFQSYLHNMTTQIVTSIINAAHTKAKMHRRQYSDEPDTGNGQNDAIS